MNTTKRILPIRFRKLDVGSDFDIFAEPSRGLKVSTDKTVYTKVCEAYSVAKGEEPERAICLYPEDLVRPLSRGK